MARLTGIIGGTFDPIHYGHLILAEHSRSEAGLDDVLFIPAMVPPHKQAQQIAGCTHRYNMTALAIEGNPLFSVSDIEIRAEGVSYTLLTMRALTAFYGPERELCFLSGADTILEIDKWYKHDELLNEYRFIVGSRPGYLEKELDERIRTLNERYDARICRVEIPEVDISSTDIRNRVRSGKSIRYLVPETVERYMLENGLYR